VGDFSISGFEHDNLLVFASSPQPTPAAECTEETWRTIEPGLAMILTPDEIARVRKP